MTGNISKKSKILRAVIFTASLLWAGNPATIKAEEVNTDETLWTLVQTMPVRLSANAALSVTGTPQNVGTIYIYGDYETYKNTATDISYQNYLRIKSAFIKPATNYQANGEYYGTTIIGIKDSYTNQTYTGRIHVGSRYTGEQLIELSEERIPRSQPSITLSQLTITITNWGIYESSGNSGTSSETTEAVNNIAEQLQTDPEVKEDLTATEEQISTTTNEAIEAEETLTDGAKQAFEAIAPEQITNKIERLQSAMEWVRTTHNKFITSNIFGDYLALILIIGFAAYLIGKGA